MLVDSAKKVTKPLEVITTFGPYASLCVISRKSELFILTVAKFKIFTGSIYRHPNNVFNIFKDFTDEPHFERSQI